MIPLDVLHDTIQCYFENLYTAHHYGENKKFITKAFDPEHVHL